MNPRSTCLAGQDDANPVQLLDRVCTKPLATSKSGPD